MEKTTLYLTDELHAILRETARRTGRRQAEVVREALTEYLIDRPRPKPRSIGLGSDAELSAADSEAWLEAQWNARADD